jgi:hypothetical protein
VNGPDATSVGLLRRENTMQHWKTMAAGAAMLISVGSTHAVEQTDGGTASARWESIRDAKGAEAYDAARAKADVANRDGYVTRDELEKYSRELIERLDRERNAQVSAPTFTDQG